MKIQPSPSPVPQTELGEWLQGGGFVILVIVTIVCLAILWWWNRPLGGGKN